MAEIAKSIARRTWSKTLRAPIVEEPPPEPSDQHPRMFMTVSGASPTVATLKTRYGSGGPQNAEFQAFIDVFCKTAANGGVFGHADFSGAAIDAAWIYAFILATWGATGINYRDATTVNTTALLNEFIDDLLTIGGGQEVSHGTALGVCYDWAHDYLSEARLQAIVNALQVVADEYGAGGYSPLGHVSGRTSTLYTWLGEVWQDVSGSDDFLVAGDITDATTRIALQGTHITSATTGTQAWLNQIAGVQGSYAEGMGYLHSENKQGYAHMDFVYWESRRTKYAVDVWATGNNAQHEYLPLWMAHMLAPYKQSGGDVLFRILKGPSTEDRPSGVGPSGSPDTSQQTQVFLPNYARVFATSNPTMAALAQWIAEELYWPDGKVSINTGVTTARWALMTNFLGYNTVSPSSPSSLGLALSIQFTEGFVVMRNAWTFGSTGGTASRIEVVAQPYKWTAKGFGQAAQGSYALHRNGPIVVQPGGGPHGAAEMGWCGNTVTFHKPADTNAGSLGPLAWNTGGSRASDTFGGSPTSLASLTASSKYDLGGFKSASGQRVELYLGSSTQLYGATYADLTRAYCGPDTNTFDTENEEVCENYERHTTWFPPDTPGSDPDFFVVCDRTRSTGTSVEQRNPFYPASNTDGTSTITVSGSSSNPSDITRDSTTSQRWLGTANTMFATLAYTTQLTLSAKAFYTPIFPTSCQIIERGSGSRRWEGPDGVPFFTQSYGAGGPLFEGNRHFELLPQTTAQTMNFLYVWELCETGGSRTTLVPITDTNVIGVRIDRASGNRKAVIHKDSTGTLTTGQFELTVAATYDVLIKDVAASTAMTFVKGSNITSVTHIATSDTDLTYTTNAQRSIWLRVVVGSSGSGASNRISFS